MADLIAEYDEKIANVEGAIKTLQSAFDDMQMAATVQGTYIEPICSRPSLFPKTIQKNLLRSGWRAIYRRLEIEQIASANDKQRFERQMSDPPPLTFENAKATFGDYMLRPRFHILRALAEVFADLDPAYRSHCNVRIGVKGLPKRIILRGWGEYASGWGVDRFKNVANALASYQGICHIEHEEIRAINSAHRCRDIAILDGRIYNETDRYRSYEYKTVNRGLRIRRFANGNAHVHFSPETLLDVNRALAEFYGEVLPDAEEEGIKPSCSTAVAKDLQFYWSPRAVVEAALEFAGISHPDHYRGEPPCYRVLEPSCGDGRILDLLREYGCRPLGVEYHSGRASLARQKGHGVVTANFLDQTPAAEFDFVIMNPPFYGRHYVKHVLHALKFLKPGGVLVAVLPATAHYDHGDLAGEWRDLPVGSFSEVGTNVPTGLLRMRVPAVRC